MIGRFSNVPDTNTQALEKVDISQTKRHDSRYRM
jgi:hypothetical protein